MQDLPVSACFKNLTIPSIGIRLLAFCILISPICNHWLGDVEFFNEPFPGLKVQCEYCLVPGVFLAVTVLADFLWNFV